MEKTTTVVPFRQVNSVDDPLTEIAREGARRMLAVAMGVEADAFVAQHSGVALPDGRQRVVRHGHGPMRRIQTGVGPPGGAAAQGARPSRRARGGEDPVHVRDPAALGASSRRASMRSCPSSTCGASRLATSRRRSRACSARTRRTSHLR